MICSTTHRLRPPRVVAFIVAAFALVQFHGLLARLYARDTGGPTPLLTSGEIEQIVKERDTRIKSLFVSYSIKAEAIAPLDVLVEQMHLTYLENLSVDFAFKGNKRYRKVTEPDFVKPLVPKGDDAKIPTMGKTETAFDGEKLLRYSASQDLMDVRGPSTAGNAGSWFPQEFMTAVGMELPNPFFPEADHGRGVSVRVVDLLSMDGLEGPRWENINKARCVVVGAANRQICWLDPAIGYALRKMEFFDPASGGRIGRYENLDFNEIAPGIWLPTTCWFDWCGSPSLPERYRGKPMVRYIYRVHKISINDVPDSLFHLDVRPGMRVVDDSRGTENAPEKPVLFVMPADSAKVDEAVQKVLEERNRSARFWAYFITLNAAALIIIAGCAIRYRYWQRKRKGHAA